MIKNILATLGFMILSTLAGAQEGVDKFRILPVDENSRDEKKGIYVRTIDFSFAKGKRYILHTYLDAFRHRKWFAIVITKYRYTMTATRVA